MANPSASLGIPYNFDGEGFRNAIRFAMQMGTPVDPDRRPIFIKPPIVATTYWKNDVELVDAPRLDGDGIPLDPNVEVREGADVQVSVDCAIEVERADAEEGPVGMFVPTKLVVTLLDDQYAEVDGAREMLYNGDRYLFGYEPENNGLFDVGVHTMVFYPQDES